ncbi:MAG: hypothetical protein ABSH07_05700 [Candidatus Dormibacteria bacterium]
MARYPEFTGKNARRFAEHFLIGTLLSLLPALGVPHLIRAAPSSHHPAAARGQST